MGRSSRDLTQRLVDVHLKLYQGDWEFLKEYYRGVGGSFGVRELLAEVVRIKRREQEEREID